MKDGYPDILYYDLYCNYPNTNSTIIPTKMYISEKYALGDLHYEFVSGSISIVVESQPLVTSISPTNYPFAQDGTLALSGSFDVSKTLYLRISYKDTLQVTTIPASIITSSQADFAITSDYFPYIGLYILEVSYYQNQFWAILPWEKYRDTIEEINEGKLHF